MKTIENILEPITGYLISITRDTLKGWYVLEVGIPKGWVFDENKEIRCDVLSENNNGRLIKISPKKTNIAVDDLIGFVEIIIKTNAKIAEREKQFADKMANMKKTLEEEAKQFYRELDELKENSFKNLNDKFEKSLSEGKEVKKSTRGRPRKTSVKDSEKSVSEPEEKKEEANSTEEK